MCLAQGGRLCLTVRVDGCALSCRLLQLPLFPSFDCTFSVLFLPTYLIVQERTPKGAACALPGLGCHRLCPHSSAATTLNPGACEFLSKLPEPVGDPASDKYARLGLERIQAGLLRHSTPAVAAQETIA